MQQSFEIDIRELFLVLIRNLKWIALASVVGALIAFGVTAGLLSPLYTSSVSLYVNNMVKDGQTPATAVNINDINASQKLVNTYIVILQDDEVMEQIAERLLDDYTQESLENFLSFTDTPEGRVLLPGTVRSVIKMNSVNNTEVLRIEAETKSAQLSAHICSLMTEVAPGVLERVVKAGSVEVIGSPKPAIAPSSPSMKVNILIGFLAGCLLSMVAALLLHMLDNTVGGEEEIKKHLNVPVLGEIPDFDMVQKGAYKNYGYN